MTASTEAQPVLRGSKVLLRPWAPGDADEVFAACQDPEIQRWTTVPSPYRHADAVQYVTQGPARRRRHVLDAAHRPRSGDAVTGPTRGEERLVYEGLHHMQLAMPRGEEEAARGFFAGTLGMTEVDKPPVLAARGGAWFRDGGLELHLGVEDDFRPARKGHPGILVSDLDEVVRRLGAAGHDVTWDGDFPGFRRVYAHDPFGNRLEFLQPA